LYERDIILELEKEVGGFRFVAEAFGIELNTVVKFFIILIVIVFDPLAIALIIAFNQLIMKSKNDENESLPEDLKNFVDETTRVHLSERDLEILEKHLLNPGEPNEKLKEAAQKYSDKVREKHVPIKDFNVDEKWDGISQEVWDRMESIEKQRESIHGPITEEDLPPTGAFANSEHREKLEQRNTLVEMMKLDQELGLYDEPFDNPLIKETISDEIPSTIEPTEEEESQNFSTIEPNLESIFQDEDYLTEAIREFNQQSIDDGEWTPELEEQFWKEQPPQPFATPEELDVDLQILNDTLNEVNGEIDNNTSKEDEKKN